MKTDLSLQERIALLNSFDANGVALIHYIVALNYYELIQTICEHGGDINIKSQSGLSPLVIAAANGNTLIFVIKYTIGYEKSVKKLIRLGAVLWNEKDSKEEIGAGK